MDVEKENSEPVQATVKATQGHISREQALNVALNIGKVLLKSGAETSRVEDTIARFCRSRKPDIPHRRSPALSPLRSPEPTLHTAERSGSRS